ncbi:hypothetical protein TNCV_711811 [Trichonephila clavipes]|nr:hypothetical protein TNCV_711811 [Trichonephila clavipes]
MSEQRDLPESMAWRVIGRLESGQTQRSVATVESPEVLLQGCGIDSKKQEMFRPRATTSSYDRYIQLTARRNRTENATHAKTVALGNRTKGVEPNST